MGSDAGSENVSRWSLKRLSLYIGPLLFIFCLLIPNDVAMDAAASAAGLSFAAGPKFGLGVLLWTATWWVFATTIPSTTPAMAIAYSSGYVRMKDMIRVGIIADTIRFILLVIIGLPLIKWFLAMKGIN